MRLDSPRIAPVPQDQWTPEQQAIAAPMLARKGPLLNIFRTQLAHPDAMRAFLDFGSYVLSKRNTLPARERELVILRVGYLCRSGYEWTQHHRIGLNAGLGAQEIERIKQGPDAPGWSAADASLLRAADELHADHFVTDPTWQALCEHFQPKQCVDLIYTVGQYTMVSMMLNTLGVQLDEGQELDPDLRKS
ncbi:carboxymuconolactone decarboxylase family protein [Quisquiliibacterium transsilvanicum]|uniref:Alkylhydroperoxidase family enzyme n=1 Tax=Quisquiliibacterium transsilvanicum TaxID=1549638 RepID=A0A7W8HKN1_9BURK|nr:alkylhydroperoxidase family enzyme [Quisquiliibacterium transsilvanicum]